MEKELCVFRQTIEDNRDRLELDRNRERVEAMNSESIIAEHRYNGDKEKGTFKTVEQLHMGEMNVKCKHCNAERFKYETGRVANNCCHGRKITLPPLTEYPDVLQRLREGNDEVSRHFRQHIRSYNDAFAFASFNCTVADMGNSGPYVMKIIGDVSYKISTSLETANNNRPRYGQIYIYDVQTQLALRENDARRANLLEIIGRLIIDINPYAANFKTTYERFVKGESLVRLNFIALKEDDRRRYNAPTCGELAALIVSDDGAVSENIEVQVFPKQDRAVGYVPRYSHHVDPMTFPLLFPSGDLGWSYNMKHVGTNKKISPVQYYGHRLALRRGEAQNQLLRSGRLTQHYVIHAYLTIESQRLLFLRNNQKQLRVECYKGMTDHISNSEANTSDRTRLGNQMILPSSFSGSMRHMQQQYQDAMAITRKVGRPDLFITMTCNPKWPEICTVLKDFPTGTTVNDIPTIACRIFNMRLQQALKEIESGSVFGKIEGYVYTVEFQKRGLPHAHILFILNNNDKLLTPEAIDSFISAEIPDKRIHQQLYQSVTSHMLHGPHTSKIPCWNSVTKSCSKKFPKDLVENTDISGGGFPKYRRRKNTDINYYRNRVEGRNIQVDNSMVVPHNPYLLAKYDCHMNVEYCASIMAIKYVFKYIHKGHDRARVQITDSNSESDGQPIINEIQDYVDSRYVGPMEAAWRIIELPMHGRSHAVTRLPVHLPGQQYATFEEGREVEAATNEKKWRTHLIAWFELNSIDEMARNITYANTPDYYSFQEATKTWKKRKYACQVVSRMTNVSPRDSERFHLKLILGHATNARSFIDLRTVNGKEWNTFREAAVDMGLTATNDEAFKIFDEAVSILMPKRLRHFFVWYLIGEMPSNAIDLWNTYKKALSEDFVDQHENRALCAIEHLLRAEARSCADFYLPIPEIIFENEADKITVENIETFAKKGNELVKQLNNDQKIIYTQIVDNIMDDKSTDRKREKCFYIDGSGGTGKTFLYNALYYMLKSEKKNVACVAWTGIAAILLPYGTTAHKTFGLPLTLQKEGTIFTNATMKKKIQSIDVFIWDECSMIPKIALELIDRTLKDIMEDASPFGGKTIILGGDFRQVLPIVKRGGKQQIIEETIKYSTLWSIFEKLSLKKNMRAKEDAAKFSESLLNTGNGEVELFVPEKEIQSNNLIDDLYPRNLPLDELTKRAILAPLNVEVNQLNTEILRRMDGNIFESKSIDYATLQGIDTADAALDEEATLRYPIEYLNGLTPSGLPPHNLQLKVGAIVMSLRNLSISDGLCNGTRLVVREIHSRI
nr:uncharacterized protein LOC124217240 [Neodiprion pinetum]